MTLFLVATPIGNLLDFSPRAIDTLKGVNHILAEDTNRAKILLKKYGIHTPLSSYHKFSEKRQCTKIIEELRRGKSFALISDAGMPAIQDPGQCLVDACLEANISVVVIPGPSSVVAALALSGFAFAKFQFVGFLPKSRKKAIVPLLYYRGVTLLFESPKRLLETLKVFVELVPERKIAIVREMTKMHEEVRRGTPAELLAHFAKHPPLGEIVLVLSEGAPPREEIALEEMIVLLQEEMGLSWKEALKVCAKQKRIAKSELYKQVHEKGDFC